MTLSTSQKAPPLFVRSELQAQIPVLIGISWVFNEQRGYWEANRIGNLQQCPYGGIPITPLQVRQIAALHGCAFGKLLLGPALGPPQGLDSLCKCPPDLRLGY